MCSTREILEKVIENNLLEGVLQNYLAWYHVYLQLPGSCRTDNLAASECIRGHTYKQ